MNRSTVDLVWNLLTLVVAEILNPLLLISTALFVGVGYILTLLMPVNIDIWAALLAVCVVGPLILLTFRARGLWRQSRSDSPRFAWRCLLPLLPLPVLLPVLVAVLVWPSLDAVAHVDEHFSYVIQSFQQVTPLENIRLPGFPATRYWLFHVYIAAVIKLTALDIYAAFSLVNAGFILASLFWLAQSLLALGVAKARTLWLGLLLLFVFGAVNVAGMLSVFAHALGGEIDPGKLKLLLLEGADRRLQSIIPKVFNASGFTPGLVAFSAMLYQLIRVRSFKPKLLQFAVFSASGIVATAFMPIIAFYLVVALLGGFLVATLLELVKARWSTATAVSRLKDMAGGLSPGQFSVWLLVSLVLALPLLKYVNDFTSGPQTGVTFALFDSTNLGMVFASSVLLLPPAGLQIVSVIRHQGWSKSFLSFSAIIGLLLTLSITLPDNNQYKFHYLLTMQLALLSLSLVQTASEWRNSTRLRLVQTYVTALVMLAIFNVMYGGVGVIGRVVRVHDNSRFDGIRIYSSDEYGGRLSAMYWIRDHAPLDAVVIIPHAYQINSMLFHQRLNFVNQRADHYVLNLPAHGQRVEQVHAFFNSRATTEDYLDLLESMQEQLPGRALYAVVMDPELSRETMAQRGAAIVFENPPYGAHVYLLNPTGSR